MTLTITWRTLAIVALWIAGVGLAVEDIFYTPNLGPLAVACISGACTMSVRGMIQKFADAWFAAYQAGRDVTARENVRKIRY